jgi:hypothetical protein
MSKDNSDALILSLTEMNRFHHRAAIQFIFAACGVRSVRWRIQFNLKANTS